MEITENTYNQLERAAELGKFRTVSAYPQLGNRQGLFRAQTESIGTGIIIDPDGDPVPDEFFQANEIIASEPLKARRY